MVKNSSASVGDTGLILGWGSNPLPTLEWEIATHSSILAWEIPETDLPGGLQSTGSQRVRHN